MLNVFNNFAYLIFQSNIICDDVLCVVNEVQQYNTVPTYWNKECKGYP